MSQINEMINVRNKYIEDLKRELLGPGSENISSDDSVEIITDNPKYRYSVGMIHPVNVKINENDEKDKKKLDEDLITGNCSDNNSKVYESEDYSDVNDDSLDEEINLSFQNKPSSIGLTFFAKGNVDDIQCSLKFAKYRKTELTDIEIPFYTDEILESNDDAYGKILPYSLQSYIVYDKKKKVLKPNLNSKIVKELKWKKYYEMVERNELEKYGKEFDRALRKYIEVLQDSFVRIPYTKELTIHFDNDYSDSNKKICGTDLKVTALRRQVEKSLYVVTIMIVNEAIANTRLEESTKCIYQPEIIIESKDNNFKFYDYSKTKNIISLSDEEQSIEMQYRNKKIYSTGMGVSVNWDIDEEGHGRIYTDFLPLKEVPGMDFNLPEEYEVNKKGLNMKYLSDLDSNKRETKIKALETLVDAYEKWISKLQVKMYSDMDLSDENKFKKIAEKNIDGCISSYKRMKKGIELLKGDDVVWNAFALANRSMFMQRFHLDLQNEYKDRDLDDEDFEEYICHIDYFKCRDKYFWRPFQIAFILMSINSIVNEQEEDRDIVDLIWFPTGGGKTEAYLGLTAFSIFYRRLKYPDCSNGTSVIMRYTLRLLTAQQFTRASTLICACEYIRSNSYDKKTKYPKYELGKEEISIGLWIGGEHTPNTLEEAKKDVRELSKIGRADNLKPGLEKYNKFQVLKCPWCGRPMTKQIVNGKLRGDWGYEIHSGHFKLVCPQEGCKFGGKNKLPIQIVDEELYKKPPTLLFGTVDKFAMMAWEAKAGRFFGVGTNNRPPELIIQDELHLISGPLGTMVGAYESVLDIICKEKGSLPKIIASTATIRGAKEQCSALYNREVVQFPHPGLDIEDSFFAREQKIDHKKELFGREYMGIMTSGLSKAMSENKVISTLMQKIQMMDIDDNIKDKYWTLTVYFNNLRELGKCATLVNDDIQSMIAGMAKRYDVNRRNIYQLNELTSRVSTSELNETLDRIEKKEYTSEREKSYTERPSDLILATNMISVGIDVPRLNVMLMVGQPKLTSEYIQASSRVSRKYPGIVFVLYDSARSRDRSHFEQFNSYHDSFYKYVEPTGITPFSKPARDRSLPAIAISVMRNLNEELADEKDAGKFEMDKFKNTIVLTRKSLGDRAKQINSRMPFEITDDSKEIEKELDNVFETWDGLASLAKENLVYGKSMMIENSANKNTRLMGIHGTKKDYGFEVMTSMRNVDANTRGALLIWEDDYE